MGLATTALGLAFALLDARSRLWTRRLLGPLSLIPIITPAFVLGLAFIYLFGRRGSITHGLLGLDTGVFFGPLGVGIAQVMAFTPIAFLVLSGVVRSLDVALEEAAQTLRATPWILLRTVTGPLLVPGLANAMLLVMIESLADFGNPILLGGGTPFLATEVFLAIEGRFDPHEAAVYGVVLLALALGALPGPAPLARGRVGRDRDRPALGRAARAAPARRRLGAHRPVPRLRDDERAPLRLALPGRIRPRLGHRPHASRRCTTATW